MSSRGAKLLWRFVFGSVEGFMLRVLCPKGGVPVRHFSGSEYLEIVLPNVERTIAPRQRPAE